jgi:hypothetical protein
LSRFRGDYRRGMDWWMDLLTTYTHHSELQALIVLSLISTLYISLHTKSCPACSAFTSCCLVTALNNGDTSACVLTSLLSNEYLTPEMSIELIGSESKSKLCYEWWSVGQSVFVSSTQLGLETRVIFVLSDSYRFVDVGHPLWL